MPLRMRLSLLFALATAVALTIAGLAFVAQLQVSVDASLDPGLRAQLADGRRRPGRRRRPGAGRAGHAGPGRRPRRPGARRRPPAPLALLTDTQRRQALGGETSFTAQIGADRTRVLAAPATRAGAPVVVAVAARTVVSDVAVERVELALLLGGTRGGAAGRGRRVAAGRGGAAARRADARARPRRSATATSTAASASPPTRDEIAALGTTINALLARLQEALHRERGFVADAGHELRTPLAILRAELELAARPGRSREALVDAINEAGEETDRLIRLAEDLLLLARADNHQPFLRPRRLSVPDLLHAAARGAATRAAEREVTVAVDVPPILDVAADPDRLRQAVDNLLDNATRHSPRGGVVELSAGVARPGVLTIEVDDRGPGFPVDFLPHAFDRFHRAGTPAAATTGARAWACPSSARSSAPTAGRSRRPTAPAAVPR